MLSGIRVKIASSVKPLNAPDDLVWKRWLKPPSNSSLQFSFDFSGLIYNEIFDEWLNLTLTESCEFYLRRVAVLQRKAFDKFLRLQPTRPKQFTVSQPKSHRLFFSIPQGKISDRLFLHNEKPALVFPVFNSKTYVAPTVIKGIELKKHLHRDTVYDTIIPSLIVIENLVPAEFKVLIEDEFQDKWELNKKIDESVCSLLSIIPIILERDKLSYFFLKKITASKNLLPTAKDTCFVSEKNLSSFYFNYTNVSGDLISNPPETYSISLLDNTSLVSSVFKLKYLILQNTPDLFQYPQEKIGLSEYMKVYTPYYSGLRIKNGGFQGLPVSMPEKGNISRNLLTAEFNSYLTSGGDFQGIETLPKTSEMPFLGKDTIQRFPKVKIRTEDPDLLPVLAVPQKYERDFTECPTNVLYEFQNNGVNLLINNSFALLADESGLGKTVQAVMALQHLAKKRRIKSTLIICNPSDNGKRRDNLTKGTPEGWLGHLTTWAPELNAISLSSDINERKEEWNTPANVYIVSYENLLYDEAEEIIDYNRLKQFDCVILDNYLSFRLTHYQRDRIFQKLKLKYLWILDNSPIEEFEGDIISYFINLTSGNFKKADKGTADSISDFTRRSLLKDLKNELPQRISRNKWFSLDKEQQRDYNVVLEQGQLKLYGSIERGNLFVIRPQIFTILHELMQVLNFSSSGNLSAKANLLLEEVKKISEHKQKTVIFSQYEKFGLKKLEELFTEHKINFVSYRAGMNNTSMEQICQNFRANKDITILLADIKAVNKNLNLGDFNHVIHFDQWWNPVSLWLAEDRVCSHNTNHVLVQYFRTANMIEEKIYTKLTEKGLLNKLIVGSLSQTTLAEIITTKEWLELFELNINTDEISSESDIDFKSPYNYVKEISYENIQVLANDFLAKAGFSKIAIVHNNISNNILFLEASKVMENKEERVLVRIYCNHIVQGEDILEFLDTLSKQKKYTKGIIINTGEFANECIKYSAVKINMLTLIDANLLAQYLLHFKLI